jgi:hypothetical protein
MILLLMLFIFIYILILIICGFIDIVDTTLILVKIFMLLIIVGLAMGCHELLDEDIEVEIPSMNLALLATHSEDRSVSSLNYSDQCDQANGRICLTHLHHLHIDLAQC